MKFLMMISLIWCSSHAVPQQHFQYFYDTLPSFPDYWQPQYYEPQFYQVPQEPHYPTINVKSKPMSIEQTISPIDNYRGFSYHTNYNDGASATVVFLRGSDSSLKDLIDPRFTVASDILDPIQSKNAQDIIDKALNGETSFRNEKNDFSNLGPVVSAILENPSPQSGVIHYYGNGISASDANNILSHPGSSDSNVIEQSAPSAAPTPRALMLNLGASENARSGKSLDNISASLEVESKLSSTTVETTSTSESETKSSNESSDNTTLSDSSESNEDNPSQTSSESSTGSSSELPDSSSVSSTTSDSLTTTLST